MISGVYKISNSVDSRIYIGSSINIYERWKEHKRALLKNIHHNIHLQRFVNKYGLDKLIFNVIEFVRKDLIIIEQKYINLFKNLFNIAKEASAPMLGRNHTKEALEKISKSSLGSNNAMYGTKRPKHVIDAMKKARWKHGASKYERLKRLINLPNRKEIIIEKDGLKLHCFSIKHASRIIGVSQQAISYAVNSKNKKSKNWNVCISQETLYIEDICINNINLFDDNLMPQKELIDMLQSL